MKSISRRLQEDKVIAKEDESGAPGGGEVSAPPSTPTPDGDISKPTSPKPDGSLSTSDVLGKCDHKHDGFFGPGCMHRPFAVFSYPVSRIKRKKRKYIKVLDLTESDDFEHFNGIANHFIDETFNYVNDEILCDIDPSLTATYNPDYRFDGEKSEWVAALDDMRKDSPKVISVALNLPAIYNFLDENSLENDTDEIGCQVKASILHEVGHGIVRYFGVTGTYDLELTENEEENLVTEYVKFKMGRHTGTKESKLQKFIDEMFPKMVNESEDGLRKIACRRGCGIRNARVGRVDDSISGMRIDEDGVCIFGIKSPLTVDFTSRGCMGVTRGDDPSVMRFVKPSTRDVVDIFRLGGKTPPMKLLLNTYGINHPNVKGSPEFPKYSDLTTVSVNENSSECGREMFTFQMKNGCEHVYESGTVVRKDASDRDVLGTVKESLDGFLGRLYRDDSVVIYGNENLEGDLGGFLGNLG